MVAVNYIFNSFPISQQEYEELDKKFGNLCHFVAWDLKRKNSKNNLTDEIEDIAQNIRWAILEAGVYTKRQRYIESCFKALDCNVKDGFALSVLEELKDLWENRTRHGASRQKFGEYQEVLLDRLLHAYVPETEKPNKRSKLVIDSLFTKYCKAIVWNRSKNLGKKITRDRHIRNGLVSLSEHAHLLGVD